jgi:fermentation-respiration switch protein FrsA (DUF1100 family)
VTDRRGPGRPAYAVAAMGTSIDRLTGPFDGGWIGGIDLAGKWMSVACQFRTGPSATSGVVVVPALQRMRASGAVTFNAQELEFDASDGSQSLRFEGAIEANHTSGNVTSGATTGTFELFREVETRRLFDYIGVYKSPTRRSLYLALWNDFGTQLACVDSDDEVRFLYPLSESEYLGGVSAWQIPPIQMRLLFSRDAAGRVERLRVVREGSEESFSPTTQVRREAVAFRNGDVTLRGTLWLPSSPGPYPALVLTHGSGPQDRYSALLFVLRLLREGVALLSFDKRGVGESDGNWLEADFNALAGDALAGVGCLRGRPDINPDQIGVWGLSQGGWVAPLAASLSRDVAFVITVSASGLTPAQQELSRVEHELRAEGRLEGEISDALAVYAAFNAAARDSSSWDSYVSARLRAAESSPRIETIGISGPDHPYVGFWRSIMDSDPLPVIESLSCPVLMVYGGVDQNVRADISVPLVEAALRRSGNDDARVVVFPTGNHVLLEQRTGSLSELADVQRFAPGYLDEVCRWVRARVSASQQ